MRRDERVERRSRLPCCREKKGKIESATTLEPEKELATYFHLVTTILFGSSRQCPNSSQACFIAE